MSNFYGTPLTCSAYAPYPEIFDMDTEPTAETFNPTDFLPGGVSDPRGRRNLNEEHLRKRAEEDAEMKKTLEKNKDKKEQKHPSE